MLWTQQITTFTFSFHWPGNPLSEHSWVATTTAMAAHSGAIKKLFHSSLGPLTQHTNCPRQRTTFRLTQSTCVCRETARGNMQRSHAWLAINDDDHDASRKETWQLISLIIKLKCNNPFNWAQVHKKRKGERHETSNKLLARTDTLFVYHEKSVIKISQTSVWWQEGETSSG